MKTFRLPDLGEGIHEAEIVDWHVGAGDNVVADQPLLSVETDKAVVEIPSPWPGRIAALHGVVGDIVHTGDPIVEFAEAGAEGGDDAGAIVGEVAASQKPPRNRARKPAASAPREASGAGSRAMPAVRRLAERLGVDLAKVPGTGPGGVIVQADVERVAGGAALAGQGFRSLRGVRRAMARNMSLAGREIVPATVHDEVDVDAWPETPAVTARLVRALCAAAKAEPALNVTFDGRIPARRMNDTVDIGIAVDTDDGLIVPVMRDAGRFTGGDLEDEVRRLVDLARTRRAVPADLEHPTITLSNFGGIAGRHANLVVVPPQVAILGAGRLAPAVVPGPDGSPAVRRVMPLSLTFDHRAVSGGEAARFLSVLMADLGEAE